MQHMKKLAAFAAISFGLVGVANAAMQQDDFSYAAAPGVAQSIDWVTTTSLQAEHKGPNSFNASSGFQDFDVITKAEQSCPEYHAKPVAMSQASATTTTRNSWKAVSAYIQPDAFGDYGPGHFEVPAAELSDWQQMVMMREVMSVTVGEIAVVSSGTIVEEVQGYCVA